MRISKQSLQQYTPTEIAQHLMASATNDDNLKDCILPILNLANDPSVSRLCAQVIVLLLQHGPASFVDEAITLHDDLNLLKIANHQLFLITHLSQAQANKQNGLRVIWQRADLEGKQLNFTAPATHSSSATTTQRAKRKIAAPRKTHKASVKKSKQNASRLSAARLTAKTKPLPNAITKDPDLSQLWQDRESYRAAKLLLSHRNRNALITAIAKILGSRSTHSEFAYNVLAAYLQQCTDSSDRDIAFTKIKKFAPSSILLQQTSSTPLMGTKKC